jgi:heptosyltransferase-3
VADVISWLISRGMKVIMTSGPDKKELKKAMKILSLLTSRITHDASRFINLCGKTTIKQLVAISEASDLFIGVDSAPVHIAAAVKTPVIALFGPTWENVWGPHGKGHVVLKKDMLCKPCQKGSCEGIELRDCMAAIKPDDVKEAVSKILVVS